MDWEANLAAIIRCTDASLEQQFRQFEDVTAEFEAPVQQQHEDPGDNVGAAYLRETMSADYRHRQQEQPRQTPSYTRVSGAFPRGPATPAQSSTTSFSEHFYRQQERKRGAGRARDNQRTHRRGNEYGPAEDAQVQDHDVDEPRYRQAGSGDAYHQQMYSSPTYDMAQMMEQVRLSLKLEVDARAAIAERQLSALLQLCKATSEELDRLRVEVCANDRQLHTLDQVQSKIRQELTTQKDIGFHLQSMCGKDESWRMQTENQMLELRQMVAALREQGNSTQAVAQEKLSRSELLVQFNAAMEPIKAQLQANIQHQAQQIAEITRATSSSSLLLDGLTQKVNRGVTDELNELRGDLNALKHHVAKLDIFQDGGLGNGRSPPVSKEETEAKAKEEQQQQEKRMTDVREGILKDVKMVAKDYVDAQIEPIRRLVDDSGSRFIGKQEIENLRSALEEGCRNRCSASEMQADSQLKAAQEQLRGENNAATRETSDRIEKSMQQTVSTMTTALEKQKTSWQNKQLELVKLVESEQKERKQALDELHEALRKSRHQLEDQIHTLSQESRTKLSQHDSDFEKRSTSMEKQAEKAVADLQRENQATVATLKSLLHAQVVNRDAEWEQKLKRLEDTISDTNLTVAALSKSLEASSSTSTSIASNDSNSKEVNMALEKQTSVFVSTMENLLQKMQLQLQVQAQSQVQMAMVPSPYHGFWPPSPYAAGHAPPPPTLHLPPAMNRSPTEHYPLTPLGAVHAISAPVSTPPTLRPDHPITVGTQSTKSANPMKEESASEENSDDRVRSATPVKQLEHQNTTSPPPSESPSLYSSPPAVSESGSNPKSTVDQGDPENSDQSLHKQNDSNKRGYTLATTVKGALEEAELAKARVENRRKQEQEAKQQPQRQPPVQAGLVTPQVEVGAESNPSETKSPLEVGNAAELGGSMKKCRHCSADVPSLDLLEHEINCDKVLKQCPHCLRRQKMSELQDHIENCDCRLVSCPNDCGGKFLQRGIPNHLATRCPKKPVTNSVPVVAAAPRPAYPDANKPTPPPQTAQPPSAAAPSGKVECKFCDDEIEASRIDDHEQNCDWKPKRCQHCNMVVISRDLLRHETSCKTNLKSCPHCNENMPQSALITHAGRCSKRPIKCIRCCQLFPADAIVAHSTNCKFVPGSNPTSGSQPQPQAAQQPTSRATIKIPPPPPFPPPPTATAPVPAPQLNTRRATADPRVGVNLSNDTAELAAKETTSDRLARRNLALSQLTNPNVPATGGNTLLQDRNSGARASAPSLYSTTANSLQTRLNMQHDGHEDAEDEEDEDDEEYDDEDEDDQLTLAQVVKEWSVENVCLWLHEDVGVPDVVLRFQQKQCNGEMLLELTESDLINDFGVKDRVQRERILNAIEAINTSTFSDEEDEDDDEEEEDANEDDEEELEESEEHNADSSIPHTRHSIGGATYGHPRDILRHKSQPSPQRILDSSLPSSNDMLRRISNALENPKR
ncbi:hypothetical protein PF004_g730 [Phytophthora fragariae]|uniref:SAM domain-containing protein n=1 Tax=Phytophthora fragariae TaxID=53985 RepID=A0A6G0PUB5_9STRA|nr:hypothetical protein PF004_g730 [Phytophthora fragariae]